MINWYYTINTLYICLENIFSCWGDVWRNQTVSSNIDLFDFISVVFLYVSMDTFAHWPKKFVYIYVSWILFFRNDTSFDFYLFWKHLKRQHVLLLSTNTMTKKWKTFSRSNKLWKIAKEEKRRQQYFLKISCLFNVQEQK